MTTQATYRCRHCLKTYTYYPSGCPYTLVNLNDDKYCPDCKEVILKALEDVPARVVRLNKPYNEITLEEVKEAIRKEDNKPGLRWSKVASPLFDMEEPKNKNRTGWITINGQEIFYSYWEGPTSDKHEVRIEIEMEKNLETGDECPWRQIQNNYS